MKSAYSEPKKASHVVIRTTEKADGKLLRLVPKFKLQSDVRVAELTRSDEGVGRVLGLQFDVPSAGRCVVEDCFIGDTEIKIDLW